MEEGELIGAAKFRTTKNGKDFIYELYLYFLDLTSEFRLVRRWYYQDNKSPPEVSKESPEWNIRDKEVFQKKIIQKKIINGWQLEKLELNNRFSFELFEEKDLLNPNYQNS